MIRTFKNCLALNENDGIVAYTLLEKFWQISLYVTDNVIAQLDVT